MSQIKNETTKSNHKAIIKDGFLAAADNPLHNESDRPSICSLVSGNSLKQTLVFNPNKMSSREMSSRSNRYQNTSNSGNRR